MTLVQVFDALIGKRFDYLETGNRDIYGGTPLRVNYCDDEDLADACIQITKDGLFLHFNTRERGDMTAATIALTEIRVVHSVE